MYKVTLINSPRYIHYAKEWCAANCQSTWKQGVWDPILETMPNLPLTYSIADSQEFLFESESDFVLFQLVWK